MRLILFPIGALIIRIKNKNFSKPIQEKYSSQDIVNEGVYFLVLLAMTGLFIYLAYKIVLN